MEEVKEAIEVERERKSEKHRMAIQIVFLIVLILAISALVGAIVTIHRYADMLMNPVGYNLARFNISSCSCIDDFGKSVQINAIGYIPDNKSIQINTVNYTEKYQLNSFNLSS